MRYKYQETAFGGLMFLVGISLLVHTFAEKYKHLLTGDDFFSPMFYPRVILVAWCAMAVGMIFNALKLPIELTKNFNLKSVFLAMLLTAGLLLLITCFGFLFAASLFFFSFSLFLGYKSKWIAAVSAVTIPYGIYLVFEKLLGVFLPTPLWQIGG